MPSNRYTTVKRKPLHIAKKYLKDRRKRNPNIPPAPSSVVSSAGRAIREAHLAKAHCDRYYPGVTFTEEMMLAIFKTHVKNNKDKLVHDKLKKAMSVPRCKDCGLRESCSCDRDLAKESASRAGADTDSK